jgi:hypothetical protein
MVGMACFLLSFIIAIVLVALVKQKSMSSGAEPGQLLAHSDIGECTDEPKNAQEPQDHDDDYHSIQDPLNGARHGDVCVDEIENDTNYDQDHHHVD